MGGITSRLYEGKWNKKRAMVIRGKCKSLSLPGRRLEPVPKEFQSLAAVETLEVQEVAVEEQDVATVVLVEGKEASWGWGDRLGS